jgi:hypothetical protein
MAGGLGERLQALEEIAQRQFDLGAQRLPVPAQNIGLGIVEPGKPQALEQAACLSLPGLIWRRILPHAVPRSGAHLWKPARPSEGIY